MIWPLGLQGKEGQMAPHSDSTGGANDAGRKDYGMPNTNLASQGGRM